MKLVVLTREDWIEIFSALCSKQGAIEGGVYGKTADHDSSPDGCHPDCEACSNQRWVKHLRRIRKMIGEDGMEAATWFRTVLAVGRAAALELRSVLEAQEDREEHKDAESGRVWESHKRSRQILAEVEHVLFAGESNRIRGKEAAT